MKQQGIKEIVKNKKARYEYEILETFEAGLVLSGTEVKSIRQGQVHLTDSYALIKGGELYLVGCHIKPYEQGNRYNVDPDRHRKLLMHKREIMKLLGQIQKKGLTLVPLDLYFKDSRVKLRLGLARGKKIHDKRQTIAERQVKREQERILKNQWRRE